MPLFHCSRCDHEWESRSKHSICDWCKAKGYIIGATTAMERAFLEASTPKQAMEYIIHASNEDLKKSRR